MRNVVTRAIVVAAVLISAAAGAMAQSASALYNQFVQQNAASADKGAAYNTLCKAYAANIEQLHSAPAGSAQYSEAYSNLLSLWPNLEYAAAYFSKMKQQANAMYMAQAYIEMPQMREFATNDFNYSPNRAQLAYFVGGNYFNKREYAKSIPFLEDYIKTGDAKKRRDVYACLIDACSKAGDNKKALQVINEASAEYPTDWNIISHGVNLSREVEDYRGLQAFLDKAQKIRPGDPTLLNIQGMLYEDTHNFEKALEVYKKMLASNPNSLEVNKHLALNYFNAGALCSNSAMTESDSRRKKSYQQDAESYFKLAIPILEKVLTAEPSSAKYNTALGMAYMMTGATSQLERQNQKLASLGLSKVKTSDMPAMMAFAGNNNTAPAATAPSYSGGNASASASSASKPSAGNASAAVGADKTEIPAFSAYAKDYIESRIREWQQKDPYETADEYKQRVTEASRNEKVAELRHQAEADYISQYAGAVNAGMFKLRPYDAENGVFLIDSDMGQLVLSVPRANNEARLFEQNWNGVAIRDPKYCIANDGLAISEITFVTPTGKDYKYSNNDALTYTETKVDVRFDDIDYGSLASANTSLNKPKVVKQEVNVGLSDVDINIPENKSDNANTFAVIIANENYHMVTKVPMAINDGSAFKQYCEKTLGLPKQNIIYFQDASYGVMLTAMKQLKDIAAAYRNDEFNVIFYYAGHGIPNEASKDSYLLPTDANGQQTEVCYSLGKLYSELGDLNAKSVLVFLDACFSGAEREGGMLASARGIALKAKPEAPRGNMVVFSAASGDETAYPYTEKNHGLFTYFLLKKIQETKGNVTLKDLGEYISDKVHKQSVVTNHKSQTPTVTASPAVAKDWRNWKLR